MYYAVFLFQQAGLAATSSSLLANGLQGVVLNVFTWVNMWYIDVRCGSFSRCTRLVA